VEAPGEPPAVKRRRCHPRRRDACVRNRRVL